MNDAAMKLRIARINRKLAKLGDYGHKLHASRGWRLQQNLGDYYILDIGKNAVIEPHVDIDELEKESNATEKVEYPEKLFKSLTHFGRERAAEERIEFVLTDKELILILQNHARKNEEYLTPSTIEYYEKLIFGAVVFVNRTMVTKKKSIHDALSGLNEFRSKAA